MYFYNKDVLEYAQTRANSKNQGFLQPAPGMHRFVQLKMAGSSGFWDEYRFECGKLF